MIDYQISSVEEKIPSIFSYITLRMERFGAVLFNPYLGLEDELDPIGAYIASLCNGHNSCRQIQAAVQRRFCIPIPESRKLISDTFEKLSQNFALNFREGIEATSPKFPEMAIFSEDNPYFSAPKSVIWDVTYECNLSCPHCLTDSGIIRKCELNTEQALHLIDILADAKVLYLSLSGGEPFLRSDLLTLLRHISTTNMRTDIATNGVELPEEILLNLRHLAVFQVQVSIDGIGEQHDRFRGLDGAFDAACRTIRRLQDEEIAVSLSTTVTAENIADLDRIIDLALDLNCSGFKAIPFIPGGRGRENAQRLKLERKGYLRLCQTLVKRSSELEGVLNIPTDTCFSFLLEPPPSEINTNGPIGCSAGYDTLSIGADGTAYPCPFLHDFPMGNLMKRPLPYLWKEAPVLRTLRTLQKQDMCEPCKSCRYTPALCRGGCRAAAYLEHGDLRAADTTCFQ